MIQIADMAAFVAVVETSSFTDAAMRLSTTKSVISRRISDVEEGLGATLLERSSRRVSPTEVGSVYYAKCVRILEAIDAANNFVSCYSDSIRGRLRVTVSRALGTRRVEDIFLEFAREYPDLVLDVTFEATPMDIAATRLDAAFRIGDVQGVNLIAKQCAVVRHALYASPAYLSSRPEPESLSDLSDHDGLLDSTRDLDGGWLLGQMGSEQLVPVKEKLSSNDPLHLQRAAEQGLGIALLSVPAAAGSVASSRLRQVLPPVAVRSQPLFMVYPETRRGVKSVQALYDFVLPRLSALDGLEREPAPMLVG